MRIISVLRPSFLVPSMVSLLVGVAMACRGSSAQLDILLVLGGLLLVGPLIGGSCIVFNQIVDLGEDLKSPRKRDLVLVRGTMTLRQAWVMWVALFGSGLALSFSLGTTIGFLAVGASFLGFAYSHPWVRLKNKPILDSLVNGTCYGTLPLLVGWSLFSGLSTEAVGLSLPLLFIFISGHMLLGLPDMEFDRSLGLRTTPVVLGYRVTLVVSAVLVTLAIGVFSILAVADWYPIRSLIVLPVLVSIDCLHIALFDESKIPRHFRNLRWLYMGLGVLFLVSLTI